jgi:hypothetical protein
MTPTGEGKEGHYVATVTGRPLYLLADLPGVSVVRSATGLSTMSDTCVVVEIGVLRAARASQIMVHASAAEPSRKMPTLEWSARGGMVTGERQLKWSGFSGCEHLPMLPSTIQNVLIGPDTLSDACFCIHCMKGLYFPAKLPLSGFGAMRYLAVHRLNR